MIELAAGLLVRREWIVLVGSKNSDPFDLSKLSLFSLSGSLRHIRCAVNSFYVRSIVNYLLVSRVAHGRDHH